MGEICALHNMNDYMHFIGIVLLYIIFIVVVIYFIYNLYCKHNTIIEKYNTPTDAAQIGTIETQEPSGYYDDIKNKINLSNLISSYQNTNYVANDDTTNSIIHNIMNNKRECTIRFKDEECTDKDGSNCQYTFKNWKESGNYPKKYITSTTNNIDNSISDNGYLNLSCFKEPKGNGEDYAYNIFKNNSVAKALAFNKADNTKTLISQANNNKGNYISMFFDTNSHNTAEAKAANLSNILNDICSYQHPIPPSLPSGTLYKLNLSKIGNDYKIDSITTATITNGVIQENTTSGDTLINKITGSNNNIIYTYDNGKFKVQKTAIIRDIDNITLYKFTYNTFCFDNKIIGVEKSIINNIELNSSSLYEYSSNSTSNSTNNEKLYPSDSDNNQIYVKYDNKDINLLNDIFLNNNNNTYIDTFKNDIINNTSTIDINNIIDTIITLIENDYNGNGDKVKARNIIENKINNLETYKTNIEKLRDDYLEKIENDPSVKYIYTDSADFKNYKKAVDVQNNNINAVDVQKNNINAVDVQKDNIKKENFTNFNKFNNIEGFGIGNVSHATTTYNSGLIGNCAGTGNIENTNRVYTIKNETIDNEPTVVSHPSIKGRIPDDKLPPYEKPLIFTFEDIDNKGKLSADGTQRIFTHKFDENVVADILVVGGGGGGGKRHGGGGGAGTLIYHKGITLNGTYTIKVGNGGNGVGAQSIESGNSTWATDGYFSQLIKNDGTQEYYANGGGYGGGWTTSKNTTTNGGQSMINNTNLTLPTTNKFNGQIVQVSNKQYINTGLVFPEGCRGNMGGYEITNYKAGGGGGAGSVGMNHDAESTIYDGYGGDGITIDITGTPTIYAGGGGGSDFSGNVSQVYDPNKPTIEARGGGGYGSDTGSGQNGKNGTGGGGGGQGNDSGNPSGNGGSGIVIIRYYVVSKINLSNITHKYLALTHSGTTENDTTYRVKFPINTTCDILIVGGGGAGGNSMGGGGGAGGVVYTINQTLNAGIYTIGVGKGGLGLRLLTDGQGTIGADQDGKDSFIKDSNGNYVSLNMGGINQNLRAYGGGGGGIYFNPAYVNGRNGGSGGGSSESNNNKFVVNTAGSALQGNTYWNGNTYVAGGKSGRQNTTDYEDYNAGGGGGAGSNGNVYKDGNNGVTINITGSQKYYAAGGGAGQYSINNSTNEGIGGSGIGGNGRIYDGSSYLREATNGTNGTGSGGGGASYVQDPDNPAGNGGSGIVIIRYQLQKTEMSSIITCENDIYTYVDKNKDTNILNFNNDNQKKLFLCNPIITFNDFTIIYDNQITNRDINGRFLKYEIISGIYECKPKYSCDITLSITFKDNIGNNITTNIDNGVSYFYEIKSPDSDLVKTKLCSDNPKYTYVNNSTTNPVALKIYANVFIINKLYKSLNYNYTITYTTRQINNFVNPTSLERFTAGLSNTGYGKVSNEISIEDIKGEVHNVANQPITTANKKIENHNTTLNTDDSYFIISTNCNDFTNKPKECTYITNMENIRNDYINAFSLENINNLFTTDIIPRPTEKYINNGNVYLRNVFNIGNINDYITEEQNSNISLRVPKFKPGAHSIYFQINANK